MLLFSCGFMGLIRESLIIKGLEFIAIVSSQNYNLELWSFQIMNSIQCAYGTSKNPLMLYNYCNYAILH